MAFAALLLIIPGFLTDIFGFLLIIPITRKFFIKSISSKFEKKNENKNVIEGEIEDEENKFKWVIKLYKNLLRTFLLKYQM